MIVLKAKVQNGRVNVPSDLPEGTEVEVKVKVQQLNAANEDRMSPEEIKQVLQARDEYFKQEFDPKNKQELSEVLAEMKKRDKESVA